MIIGLKENFDKNGFTHKNNVSHKVGRTALQRVLQSSRETFCTKFNGTFYDEFSGTFHRSFHANFSELVNERGFLTFSENGSLVKPKVKKNVFHKSYSQARRKAIANEKSSASKPGEISEAKNVESSDDESYSIVDAEYFDQKFQFNKQWYDFFLDEENFVQHFTDRSHNQFF